MQSFVLLLIAGVIAQLVDGSLGMAFGVTNNLITYGGRCAGTCLDERAFS